jgi:hypothetical protein
VQQFNFFSRFVIGFALLFFISGCEERILELNQEKHFFDLKKFVEKESERLKKQNLPVLKKVAKGEKKEQKNISNLVWKDELMPIAESDLNRPAWKSQYNADTSIFDKSILVTYTGLNKDLAVKKMALTFDKETKECLSISIDKASENFLYSSWQKIYYTAGGHLNIYGQLDMHGIIKNEYASELVVINTNELE